MKILVGFDDSEGAWDAIALARTLCAITGAEAFVVQVASEERASLDLASGAHP